MTRRDKLEKLPIIFSNKKLSRFKKKKKAETKKFRPKFKLDKKYLFQLLFRWKKSKNGVLGHHHLTERKKIIPPIKTKLKLGFYV